MENAHRNENSESQQNIRHACQDIRSHLRHFFKFSSALFSISKLIILCKKKNCFNINYVIMKIQIIEALNHNIN